MKIKTYRDLKTGKVGIELIPEFCCEEETLILDLLNKKIKIIKTNNLLNNGIALVMDENKFSPFAGLEDSKGRRFKIRR